MGEFTQNLLKLTEFPFSYSLMGLLALIFGQSANPEELAFAKYGPLLILTGFVATTLSICDPVGALQRLIIKGRKLISGASNEAAWFGDRLIEGRKLVSSGAGWFPWFQRKDASGVITDDSPNSEALGNMRIFGREIRDLLPFPYILAIRYSPDEVKRFSINWESAGFDILDKILVSTFYTHTSSKILLLLEGLKQQTVKTKWITAEIDRITALVYFIIIISFFIVATQLYPAFLQNFGRIFEDIESTKLGILIFSILALIAVSFMFVLRIGGLMRKALTVFRYLTALGAIKADKERFRTTLQDIERYLNDNDWTLAEYWVTRIQDEYAELFQEEASVK